MKNYRYLLLILLAAFVFAACDDDENTATKDATLEVVLTDAPGDFEEVNIDVQDVLINKTTSSSSGWESVGLDQTGVYNLLELTNGLDTLLGSITLPPGTISQVLSLIHI